MWKSFDTFINHVHVHLQIYNFGCFLSTIIFAMESVNNSNCGLQLWNCLGITISIIARLSWLKYFFCK